MGMLNLSNGGVRQMTINVWEKWWQKHRENERSKRLQRELMRLLHNRSDIAQQSIARQKREHPGQPESWYLDKVIYDLEREA